MRTFKPPASVARAAEKGLKLRASLPTSRRCCTAVGIRRASQLKNRQQVSLDTLKRMKAYFDRHEVDKSGKGWGVDSKGYQAWLLWGGEPGRKWANEKLAAYRPNDFKAKPEEFAGGASIGVAKYPGFHTASDKETTYAYAQQKVIGEVFDWDLGPETLVHDYPVVVALDMSGLRPKTDYDAVETVRPVLCDIARQLDRDAPLDDLLSFVEGGDYQDSRTPTRAFEWLFEYGSGVLVDPASALLSFAEKQSDPNDFLRALADGSLSDEALAAITGQFRYTEDVPAHRIVEVWYVRPWWPEILTVHDEPSDDELIDALDAAGWNVITDDDVYNHSLSVDEKSVHKRKVPSRARVEFHGTTYRNLLRAAPDIDWPTPPPPYQ